jgi:hypothetical protein
MDKLPVSRAEAKAAGAPQYFTGKPCSKGHLAPKFTCSGSCAECLATRRREYMREWSAKNPELKKQRAADWYQSNREEIIERVRANYHKDLDKSRQRARDYAETHRAEARERIKKWSQKNPEKKRQNDKTWIEANKARSHSLKAKYRAARRQACPPWVDDAHMAKIHDIYRLRRELTDKTGTVYEVDHIVPLQGKTVCGLHVWWNLRVIPKEENNRRPRIWDSSIDTP